jgi:hypothetical protein
MKKFSLFHWIYIIGLAILLATCDCNNNTTRETTQQPTPPQRGYWHTGTHKPGDILEIKDYPTNSYVPHLYQLPWKIYRVKHNGSCAFQSFIPLLFHEILRTGKLERWLAYIHTNVYQPAQKVIQKINLPEKIMPPSYQDSVINSTVYNEFKELLYKLHAEPEPRPLREEEIGLSVRFLRQCLILNAIKSGGEKYAEENLTQFLQDPNRRVITIDNFWAYGSDFTIFNQFYAIMNQKHPASNDNALIMYFSIHGTDKGWMDIQGRHFSPQDLVKGLDRWDSKTKKIFRQNGFPEPRAMMYHHDNVYYEYIIYEKGDKFHQPAK